MADLREQYNVLTDLRPFPKIAQAIGVYTAQFGATELGLWQVFAAVMKIEEDDAMILLGSIQSFTARLDCIEQYFMLKRNDMKCNLLIRQIIKSARNVNAFRNKIAHGIYQTNMKNEKIYLLAFATDPSVKWALREQFYLNTLIFSN